MMRRNEKPAIRFLYRPVMFAFMFCVITAFISVPEVKHSLDNKPLNDLNKNGKLDVYEDSSQPVGARVEDLLAQMTLEEKAAQTQCIWLAKFQLFTDSQFDIEKAKKVMPYGLGQIARPSEGFSFLMASDSGLNARENAELTNSIQKYFIENTRLGIPVIFHEESLHGHQAVDATVFPSALGMASSWNESLFTDVYSNVAKEVRYRGGHQVLAPVLDITIDPRWGRTGETLGEDPYLSSRLGLAVVKAYQGNSEFIDKDHVVATLKHLGVHGQPEGGGNTGPVFFSERHVRQVFLKPFQTCVEEGGVLSVMASYPEISGVPSHADQWLLTDLLRDEWGFQGMVVADYSGIQQLHTTHAVAGDAAEAALLAITAGVDVELPDRYSYSHLADLVRSGELPVEVMDRAVCRILDIKFRLGLFDDPYVDPQKAEELTGSARMRALALEAARQSMVLLKNTGELLPLDRNQVKKIAVIGPHADQCILGGYSGTPKQTVTPLQAIKEKYPDVDMVYAKGCELIVRPEGPGRFMFKQPAVASREDNLKLIQEAVAAAGDADVILLMLGGNTMISRESTGRPGGMGDLANLELFGDQNELIDSLSALKIPMAAFVFSGPPVSFSNLSHTAESIVQCWYLGQETGYAVAETIFGDNNPTGKLTISIPRSAGHIPAYYYYKPSARRGYNFDDVSPLYPFGFGLSYTTFEYENLKISAPQMKMNASVDVSVDVTNTGGRDGAEIVQLYIRDKVSTVTRPVKELKDFRRVAIKTGETKRVTFTITPDKLEFFNFEMNEVVEPGEFEIMVGPSSDQLEKLKLTVIK